MKFHVAVTLVATSFGYGSAIGETLDEKLPIGGDQQQVLMEKTATLEAQIQQRQQQQVENTERPQDSMEYQAGFSDGYNKAIIDLVKSRLLNDRSLLPKPMAGGIQHAPYAQPTARAMTDPLTSPAAVGQPYRPSPDPVVTRPMLQNNADPYSVSQHAMEQNDTDQNAINPNTGNSQASYEGEGGQVPQATPAVQFPAPVVATQPSASTAAEVTPSGVTDNPSVVTQDEVTTVITTTTTAATTAITSTPSQVVVTSPVTSRADSNSNVENRGANDMPSRPVVAPTTNAPITNAPITNAPTTAASSRERVQGWLQKGNAHLKEKEWSKAIDAATAAMAIDPGTVESYIMRSWAYAEGGQYQRALDDTVMAIKLDPNNALVYNNRAYVYELENEQTKAQESYQQACDLNYQPACATAQKLKRMVEQQHKTKISELTDLSYQQFQQKDWKGVIKTTTDLLALDPENTVALVNRAGAYTELGLYNKALDDCNNALIIDPNMAIAYNNKGYVLELTGQLKKAAMEYETACVLGVQQSCGDFKRLSR